MATIQPTNIVTLTAGEDLTAKQHRFVKIDTSGQVVLAGAGDPGIGVLLNKPDDLEAALVQIAGITKVQVDAAVTAGDRIMSSADGQAATKTGTNNSMGLALETATTAGQVIELKLDQSDGVAGGGVGSFENEAITPGVSLALITVAGTDALTLADGTFAGQRITIVCIAASATPVGTLTLNDAYTGESTTVVFTDVGQQVTYAWTSSGWKLIEARGVETKTSGALEPRWETSYLSVTNTVAFTLAAGTRLGQRKRIECSAVSGTPVGTLTVADMAGTEPTAWVFNTVGQAIDLEWQSGGWHVYNIDQLGIEVLANAGTANPLNLVHQIDIADTVDFILGAGLVAGQRAIFYATAHSGTPVGTVSGLFYDEDFSADGVDVNFNATADMADLVWLSPRWYLQAATSTTVST